MKKSVLCAGRLYCDLVFTDTPRLPTAGTEVFAPGLSLHAGGGAFITGATLASLGHSVTQASILPAAPFDGIVLADMDRLGVNAIGCVPAPLGTDPQITVAIACAQDRAFLTRADGPACPDPATMDFSQFAHLHIGELSSLQDVPTLLDYAKAAGLTVSLDCGWQDSFDPAIAGLIARVDVFLPNENEAKALRDIGLTADLAPLTVIKCGDQGARARVRGANDWTVVNTRPAKVLDATGAGDSFNAGFLSAWLEGATLAHCLTQGNRCGHAAVQAIGGAGNLQGHPVSAPTGLSMPR